MYNWSTLNGKVLHKLGFSIPKPLCEAASRAVPMAVEKILKFLRYKFVELMEAEEQQQVPLLRCYYALGCLLICC